MTTRLLLVDDHGPFVASLGLNLRARGYEVMGSATAEEAIASYDAKAPDLVLLDLGLPDRPGVDVVTHIRRHGRVPILVVSARRDAIDRVALLDAGADGYITKPFGLEELLARIRAALRRSESTESTSPGSLRTEHFELDLDSKLVRTHDGVVRLTRREWAVVECLVRARGRLVPPRELQAEVWGSDPSEGTGSVRTHLGRIRKKLEPDPAVPIYFVTEPGRGVRFESAPSARPGPEPSGRS